MSWAVRSSEGASPRWDVRLANWPQRRGKAGGQKDKVTRPEGECQVSSPMGTGEMGPQESLDSTFSQPCPASRKSN